MFQPMLKFTRRAFRKAASERCRGPSGTISQEKRRFGHAQHPTGLRVPSADDVPALQERTRADDALCIDNPPVSLQRGADVEQTLRWADKSRILLADTPSPVD